jgi:phosphoglycolate phosphatase
MFSLLIFDLDGTLVDSLRDITESANALLEEHGAAPLAEARIGRMVGEGSARLVARAFEAAGVAQPSDALERYLAIYSGRLLRHTRPYPGIPEALASLAARLPLAVLTNKPLAATRAILDGLDLARYFDPGLVLGGDGPLPRKPDPAGLDSLAARAHAAPASTLLVGDSLIDWETAHAAGARVCLARYGFGFRSFPAGRLQPADLSVRTPPELLRLAA